MPKMSYLRGRKLPPYTIVCLHHYSDCISSTLESNGTTNIRAQTFSPAARRLLLVTHTAVLVSSHSFVKTCLLPRVSTHPTKSGLWFLPLSRVPVGSFRRNCCLKSCLCGQCGDGA